MKYDDYISYQKKQKRLRRENIALLAAAALLMAALWVFGSGGATPHEEFLMARVREAQNHIWELKEKLGAADETADPDRTGLIGFEWSGLSTTLGSLPAKRTSCDPRWAAVMDRWFDKLNIKRGDSVLLLSSSSFPGLILNTLTAAEARGVKLTFVLSLGSSSWGANVPKATWPEVAAILRRKGLIRSAVYACTPGGDRETGGGLSDETIEEMRRVCRGEGTRLVIHKSLEEVIDWKMDIVHAVKPKVVISIGGSESNMGGDEAILNLSPGLHTKAGDNGGNGVIGLALAEGIPVIHLLNIKKLAAEEGIPFDARRGYRNLRGKRGLVCAAASLCLFAAFLFVFKGRRFARAE